MTRMFPRFRALLSPGVGLVVVLIVSPTSADDAPRVVRWLEAKIEGLQVRHDRLEALASDAQKDRDEALRVAKSAQRDLDDTRRQKVEACEQRDAAKNGLAAMRIQHQTELNFERNRTQEELLASRQRADKEITAQQQRMQNESNELKGALSRVRGDRDRFAQRCAAAQTQVQRIQREVDAARKESLLLYDSGRQELENNDLVAAAKSFTKAIERYPNDARYFYFRALARRQAANAAASDDAMADVKHAMRLEKQDAPDAQTVDKDLQHIKGEPQRWLEKHRIRR